MLICSFLFASPVAALAQTETAYDQELRKLEEIDISGSDGQIDALPSNKSAEGRNFVVGTFLLLCTAITALVFISLVLMRGLSKIVDLQHQSFDLASKERKLKQQEKVIIATMLDSEIRENREKIDAYLLVYEETLRDFEDQERKPKYQSSGDIVQKQPSLSRSVFDGNTHRLEMVGGQLASDLIHYYARIKTVPEYIDIEPETPVEEAQSLIISCVENAKKLRALSDDIADKFVSYALVKPKTQ